MGHRNSLLVYTILSLLNDGLCYGPISPNPVTIPPSPSENDGLKFLGSANDYGLASPSPTSSVASSAVPHYWWQRVQSPFVSDGCTSSNCQPSVVLHVPSSPHAKMSTGNHLQLATYDSFALLNRLLHENEFDPLFGFDPIPLYSNPLPETEEYGQSSRTHISLSVISEYLLHSNILDH